MFTFIFISFSLFCLEWHEDTQIEPVAAQDYISVDNYYGTGLEYEAYGERYLDILRKYT